MNEELKAQRKELADAMYGYTYGAFPGSKAWHYNQKIEKALEDFDRAHPEIKAQIEAAKAAAKPELTWDKMNSI